MNWKITLLLLIKNSTPIALKLDKFQMIQKKGIKLIQHQV